ncbi:uncharacterized protein I206_103205 [Kwoniella pini CBS 10737]|uniref:TLC domain-containing protein n=1 Tax=Kwoniella pini CBS 10737 TaxID=1296096 RepID=A0A1B9IAP6_9TREE|nr:uncharacterized protein I206_01790 [Kwoniella pini CBS 10737]OCF52500.1 hypothetical protein I206_01790 [Kwoniella pini CBS 10737]
MMIVPLLCGLLYALFYFTYQTLSLKFDTERKRAYILSVISSFTMTTLSIPFFINYLRFGLERTFKDGQKGWLGMIGEFGTTFFGVYLFAFTQLTIGYLKYRSQVGLLTGWIHHTVYIGLMFYLARTNTAPIFLTGAVMELPTFDLGLSNLFPSVRNDLRFLSSFFVFRILYHVYLLIDVARLYSRSYMGDSWVPTIMLGLALLMHISWFKGGLSGYVKRQSKIEANVNVNSQMDNKQDLIIDAVSEYDISVKEVLPITPEDSPLITPRTPSVGPSLLLPHIQIPNLNLPNLPSFTELTAALNREKLVESGNGFKEAVKHRWDEQKEKFNTKGQLLGRRSKIDTLNGEESVTIREVVID